MMDKEEVDDIVFLRTGLFGKTDKVTESVSGIEECVTRIIELQPEQMGSAEWDAVVDLVLHASKVVTV